MSDTDEGDNQFQGRIQQIYHSPTGREGYEEWFSFFQQQLFWFFSLGMPLLLLCL